jgi:hypothetical protein
VTDGRKLALWGLFTIAMGLFPLLASFDVIATDDGDFGGPRWLVAAIGHLFVLVGVWLTLTRAPDWPLTALLRMLIAPLQLALCALFCVAVVLWPHRVGAAAATRDLFVLLAVCFAAGAGVALARVARTLRRPARR